MSKGAGNWSRLHGARNRERVRQFFADKPSASRAECSKQLGLSIEAIGRHLAALAKAAEAEGRPEE